MHERFSDRARRALALANQEAIRLHHESLSPLHILLGILAAGSGVAIVALRNRDIDPEALKDELNRKSEPGTRELQQTKMAQSADTRQVIQYAIDEARKLGHRYVGTEHLLMGILREGRTPAAQSIIQRGVKLEVLREEILTLLRSSTSEDHARAGTGHDGLEWVHQQELAKAFRSPNFWHRLILAVDSANRLGHGEIKDEHLLLALLREPDSFVAQMLAEKGVTVDWVRDRITRAAAL
ncbi:MAG TPA: Clp protease N-terminal domain-containing protein [Phycisphaerae bacterium]|nr:Clp protease N-terminal domain-containing protein [Phycisphaerae bacterium]